MATTRLVSGARSRVILLKQLFQCVYVVSHHDAMNSKFWDGVTATTMTSEGWFGWRPSSVGALDEVSARIAFFSCEAHRQNRRCLVLDAFGRLFSIGRHDSHVSFVWRGLG